MTRTRQMAVLLAIIGTVSGALIAALGDARLAVLIFVASFVAAASFWF